MLGPVAIAGLLFAAVTVQGTTTCPTPKAVEARLGPLVSTGAASDVRLEREGPALHVALYSPDGRLTARRSIDGAHSCEALAEAAAVIVAAWQGDVGDRPLLAAEAPTAAAADLRATTVPAAVAAAGPGWGLAAAGGLSLAATTPAPTAAMTITHAPVPASPWSARLGLAYQGPRESALGTGKLRWQRWVVELGPQLQAGAGPFGWALHLGGVLGVTRLQGRALADARDHQDFGLGISGGARLSLGRSGLRPFLELGARGWPADIVAYEGSAGGETTLPRVELLLTLGAAFGR
jgi:hypothetical protein